MQVTPWGYALPTIDPKWDAVAEAERREEWLKSEARRFYTVFGDRTADRDDKARAALTIMDLEATYNEETGDTLISDADTAYTIAAALADWARLNGLEAGN